MNSLHTRKRSLFKIDPTPQPAPVDCIISLHYKFRDMARTKFLAQQQNVAARAAAQPYLRHPNLARDAAFALFQDDEGNWVYEVEAIVDHRFTSAGLREFNVKWKHFPLERALWRPEASLIKNADCAALLNAYCVQADLVDQRDPASL